MKKVQKNVNHCAGKGAVETNVCHHGWKNITYHRSTSTGDVRLGHFFGLFFDRITFKHIVQWMSPKLLLDVCVVARIHFRFAMGAMLKKVPSPHTRPPALFHHSLLLGWTCVSPKNRSVALAVVTDSRYRTLGEKVSSSENGVHVASASSPLLAIGADHSVKRLLVILDGMWCCYERLRCVRRRCDTFMYNSCVVRL